MPNRLKISDVPRVATLLKKLVEKSDVNKDGAVRSREARMGITSKKKRCSSGSDLRSARFACIGS